MTKNKASKKNVKKVMAAKTDRKSSGIKRKFSTLNILTILLILIFVLSLIYKALAYTYDSIQAGVTKMSADVKAIDVKNPFLNPKLESDKDTIKAMQTDNVQNRVSKLVKVPSEDVQKIEKVKDPALLVSESDFYKGVEAGDYIITYPSLSIIYSLKYDKIIRTGSVIKKW